MTDYLLLAEVLAIHDDQMSGMAACAVSVIPAFWKPPYFDPQTDYYADLIQEAAALWESLAQNHAFIDGNKRVAFAATYTFLEINGARLTADAETTYAFIAELYKTDSFDFAHLNAWLRETVALDGKG